MRRLLILLAAAALAVPAVTAADSEPPGPPVLRVGAVFPTPGFLRGPRSSPRG